MDPLRLLTRSIQRRPVPSGRGGATPSAGPASNPQLFAETDTSHSTSNGSRKRKRATVAVDDESRIAPGLDFFGGSAAQSSLPTKPIKSTLDQEERNDQNQNQEEEQRKELNQEERKELLARHKVKVTLLNEAEAVEAPSKKKTKSKTKDKTKTKSKSKSRPHIYPEPVSDFRRLRSRYALSHTLAQNIDSQGYTTTTEVQLAALPLLLAPFSNTLLYSQSSPTNSRVSQSPPATSADPVSIDVLAVAPTGSGKTLAFTIPLIQALLRDRHQSNPASDSTTSSSRAIILAPTKELANQICNEARKLALNTGIKATTVRKGMHFANTQHSEHAQEDSDTPLVKADILVATPAALLNAFKTAPAHADGWSDFRYLVLDEADVLLDPLFRDQTLDLWNALMSPSLRVSFWSATMGSNIEELVKSTMDARLTRLRASNADDIIDAPFVRLVVGLKDSAVPNIDHQLVYAATEQGKLMGLRQLLHPAPTGPGDQPTLRAPFLVFTQTIERAVALHSELQYDIPPEAGGISRIAVLHSDLSDTARDRVMTGFRKGEIWILITTDLLSRGVDFRGINGVVNYDVPTSAAAYVHRVGRTGRAGREGGIAVTYYTDDDVATIKTVANLISASQKLRGSDKANANHVQQWLLDALPTPSKRDKQQLKKRGIESRRSTSGKDAKTGAAKTRISTKSGYLRKMENNRRGAIEATRRVQQDEVDSGSEGSFGGFDD